MNTKIAIIMKITKTPMIPTMMGTIPPRDADFISAFVTEVGIGKSGVDCVSWPISKNYHFGGFIANVIVESKTQFFEA